MKIVAVTACPSGVAHTYMSAEALERASKSRGIDIKVETQGSIGIENKLAMDDIEDADVVILTKDIGLKETERFNGKTIVRIGVSDLVKRADRVVEKIEAHIKNKQK